MALNALIMENKENTAKNWRGILRGIYGNEDGIMRGCAITNTGSAVTIAAGYYILGGVVIEVDGATITEITPALQTGYVRLKTVIDLTQEQEEQVKNEYDFSATTTFPALIQQDIASSGTKYETEMCVYQISGGNVTTQIRKIKNLTGVVETNF